MRSWCRRALSRSSSHQTPGILKTYLVLDADSWNPLAKRFSWLISADVGHAGCWPLRRENAARSRECSICRGHPRDLAAFSTCRPVADLLLDCNGYVEARLLSWNGKLMAICSSFRIALFLPNLSEYNCFYFLSVACVSKVCLSLNALKGMKKPFLLHS